MGSSRAWAARDRGRARGAADASEVRGVFCQPGSAEAAPAILVRKGPTIIVRAATDGWVLGAIPARRVRVARRRQCRAAAHAGAWTFETADASGLDRLLTAPVDRLLPWLRQGWGRVAMVAALFTLLTGAAWQFGIPAATRLAVDTTPGRVERAIEGGTLEALDTAIFEPSAAPPRRQQRLKAAFGRLIEAYRARPDARLDPDFRLLFRAAPLVGPNALALPGGIIVVTDELLALLPEDEPIIAVMAHEIGHVHHRHGLYALYRSAGVGALVLFLGGDLGALAEQAVAQGASLSNLASSRGMERQADLVAIDLTLAAGYDPMTLVSALEALTDECARCAETSWLSSHPGTRDRADRIRKAVAERQ